jgi:fermentation-respiration switch protein FrsA (DUF1100 family)
VRNTLKAKRNKLQGTDMPPLLKYVFWPLCIYAAYCGLLFLLQRQIMFPRGMIPQPPPSAQKSPGLEPIWLKTESGKVESWLLAPVPGSAAGPAPAVIFGHGNGELIDFWPDDLKGFGRLGMAVLLVEYPGYGRSAGSPSQASITEAFVAAYDALTAREDIDASRIVLFGRSLGGGAVCALSLKRPSAAQILMSTFTSARSFAKRYLAPSFLVRDPLDNLAAVEQYEGPVLIIHGRHDTVIPYSHGKALYKAARAGKLIAYDAGHNDCPPDWTVFWQDVETFLRSHQIIT